MEEKLRQKLIELADKYENPDFITRDPSQFMHRFTNPVEQEAVAFLSANLAFGRRDQIISHIEQVLEVAGSNPLQWIKNGEYRNFFNKGTDSFYRMYSHDAMNLFFDSIRKILEKYGSIGEAFKLAYQKGTVTGSDDGDRFKKLYLCQVIPSFFPSDCTLIARGKGSAAKKLNMFLRWMVRDNSPVDLGLWNWYPKTDLLMPLDTHVMQEATKFGLLPFNSNGKEMGASFKTALLLTQKMSEAFPEDPVRGDFALFGLGVNSNLEK